MENKMYRREKRIIVSLISTFLILGLYSLLVYNKYVAGDLTILNDFKFWGRATLILLPVMIVAQIIIHIIFFIINKIVTDEDIPAITDEMDKLIDLKSIRVSQWAHVTGFILAMASLALGMQPFIFFIILISSCFASSVISESIKIYYYRKGI